ncbi:hypothetical protein H072_10651 [Dactylellina haptotyla CBS 200.50]|uniref:Uncharacterized protein n=1 Tax=Dactylellina haptotyla (strain CBS 200.50) TaxID=1284197 RepID=S8A452_DACHA|nr:hypothetical protein H072_10651 [Dactylellina haptotyla CBS 200.50]
MTDRDIDGGFFTYKELQENQGIPFVYFMWCGLAAFTSCMFIITLLFAWDLSLFALPWIFFSITYYFREPIRYRTMPFVPARSIGAKAGGKGSVLEQPGWKTDDEFEGHPPTQDFNGINYQVNRYESDYHCNENYKGGYAYGTVEPPRIPDPGAGKGLAHSNFTQDAIEAIDREDWYRDDVGN